MTARGFSRRAFASFVDLPDSSPPLDTAIVAHGPPLSGRAWRSSPNAEAALSISPRYPSSSPPSLKDGIPISKDALSPIADGATQVALPSSSSVSGPIAPPAGPADGLITRLHSLVEDSDRDAETARREVEEALIERTLRRQQMKRLQEEAILDDMHSCVARLSEVTHDISLELGVQSQMLQEFQDEVEDSSSTMSTTLKKLDKLIEKSGRSHCCIILCLSAVAFILFLLVVSL